MVYFLFLQQLPKAEPGEMVNFFFQCSLFLLSPPPNQKKKKRATSVTTEEECKRIQEESYIPHLLLYITDSPNRRFQLL